MTRKVLRDYQEDAVWRMVSEPSKSVLIGSEQDTGKTLTTVEFLKTMNFARVLIVGIKDTQEQWAAVARNQGVTHEFKPINTTAQGKRNLSGYEAGEPGWYFIGHQLFVRRDHTTETDSAGNKIRTHQQYWAGLPPVDCAVVDEVHVMANERSAGATTLHSLPTEWKVALSGTWYGNKFENAWAPTRWLWPGIVSESFYFWKGKYCLEVAVKNKWGKPVLTPNGRTAKAVLGEKEPGRFVSELPCYIRVENPDKIPPAKVIEVDLVPEQRKIYDQLEEEGLAYLESKPWVLELPVSQRTALKTVTLGVPSFTPEGDIDFAADAVSTKYDALISELEEHPGERVVIATDRKRYARYVANRMREDGYRVAEWHGGVNTASRTEIKRQWLANEIDYIVCVMKSFSTGLDWVQTNCWRIGVLSSPEGDAVTKDQFLRRVFRTGPTKLRFEWFEILARDTYDGGTFNNLELRKVANERSMTLVTGEKEG